MYYIICIRSVFAGFSWVFGVRGDFCMPDDPPGRLRHAEPGRSEGDFGCPSPHPPGCKATNVEPSGCASGKNMTRLKYVAHMSPKHIKCKTMLRETRI